MRFTCSVYDFELKRQGNITSLICYSIDANHRGTFKEYSGKFWLRSQQCPELGTHVTYLPGLTHDRDTDISVYEENDAQFQDRVEALIAITNRFKPKTKKNHLPKWL